MTRALVGIARVGIMDPVREEELDRFCVSTARGEGRGIDSLKDPLSKAGHHAACTA